MGPVGGGPPTEAPLLPPGWCLPSSPMEPAAAAVLGTQAAWSTSTSGLRGHSLGVLALLLDDSPKVTQLVRVTVSPSYMFTPSSL